MTIEQAIQGLKGLEGRVIEAAAGAALYACEQMRGDLIDRIHTRGETANGGGIGTYKNYDLYAPKSVFVAQSKFKPNTGKRGKILTTFYTPQGWAGVRAVQGYPTDKVILNYTGSTKLSYETMRVDVDTIRLQFNNADIASIARANESRYKSDIFVPSDAEVVRFRENFQDEYETIIKLFQ